MAFSKRFATYRRKLGIDDKLSGERRSKVNFHSFRRWVATKFDYAQVPEVDAARILAHKITSMTYGTYSDARNVPSTSYINCKNRPPNARQRLE